MITHLLSVMFLNFFFINNYLAYFIIFLIDFVRLEHFVIKWIINNLDVKLDVIKI